MQRMEKISCLRSMQMRDYEYTVTLGDETLTANDEGKYTIPAAKITGTALTVKVEKTEKSALTVDVSKYIDLNGKNHVAGESGRYCIRRKGTGL